MTGAFAVSLPPRNCFPLTLRRVRGLGTRVSGCFQSVPYSLLAKFRCGTISIIVAVRCFLRQTPSPFLGVQV